MSRPDDRGGAGVGTRDAAGRTAGAAGAAGMAAGEPGTRGDAWPGAVSSAPAWPMVQARSSPPGQGPAGQPARAAAAWLPAAARRMPERTSSRAMTESMSTVRWSRQGGAGDRPISWGSVAPAAAYLSYPRPVRNGPGLATVGLLAVMAACGESREPETGPSDAAPREAARTAPGEVPGEVFEAGLIGDPAPPEERFSARLVEPGREPRRLLRYQVSAGDRQRGAFESESTMDVFTAARRLYTQRVPSTRTAFELTVEAVDEDGFRGTLSIEEAESVDWERIAPGRGAELRRSLTALRGHKVPLRYDRRGVPGPLEFELPDSIEEARGVALNVLRGAATAVISLPAEPVGPGARWEVSWRVPGMASMAGPLLMEYTLVSIQGDRLEIELTMRLPTVHQPLEIRHNTITGYSGGGTVATGTARVDLRRLIPLELDTSMTIAIEGRILGAEEMPLSAGGTQTTRLRAR